MVDPFSRQRLRSCPRIRGLLPVLAAVAIGLGPRNAAAIPPPNGDPIPVIIDTDVGDDIDDAFALGLVLRSPELKVVGISTAFGDTDTRARLTDRFLAAIGDGAIPVTAGVHTETDNPMTQRTYGEQSPARKHPDGVAAMQRFAVSRQVRR